MLGVCMLCAAISGEISILTQTGAESWGRFPVPRICQWESSDYGGVWQRSNGVSCQYCKYMARSKLKPDGGSTVMLFNGVVFCRKYEEVCLVWGEGDSQG